MLWECEGEDEQNTEPIASGESGHSLASINVVFGDVEQRKY